MKNKPGATSPIRMPARLSLSVLREAIRCESGNAMIELALSATVLVTLLLGSVELGMLAYSSIEISNAAHAGAQYGSQSHTSAANSAGMKAAAIQDAHNVSGMTATTALTCSCEDGSSSTCAVGDCSASRIIEFVQVNTTATVTPPVKVPGLPTSYTLNGKAIMRVVQ